MSGDAGFAPDHREALAAFGIVDHDSAMTFSGGALVAVHRGRSVVRLDGGFFLKRWPAGGGEARRERRAMERLAAIAGPDPAVLAAWGEGDGAFLVTKSPEGAVPLSRSLPALRGEDRRKLLALVGRRIRALHDAGLTCPDLVDSHLFAGLPDRVVLIDAGRLGRRRGLGARVRDLAALEQSLPFGVASAADRLRILAAWLDDRPSRHPDFRAAFARAARKLARRLRHRRGTLVATPADREFLASLGIRDFAGLMSFAGGDAECLRKLEDRENWRIAAGGREFFVKRHRPVRGAGPTPAAAEWEASRLLRRSGIRAARAAVCGEDVETGSTVWMERSPGRPLDDVLREGGLDDAARREVVVEAAAILRRMRRLETHHRDMYLCHLLCDATAPAGRRLTVIDLQRVRRKRGLRERWYVKDVAALLHSAPRPPVTRTDLARFLRVYFGVPKLGRREKRFAARVVRKAGRMGARS